jgi:phospholipid/cholesterol/gamma-HCH transport system ATP-binding protein
MEKEKIIEVKNISVRYSDRTILENVSFDIYKGEIFVIVGGSGCGKSTLLRQIIGLEQPSEGEILINGENLTTAKGKKKRKILRKFGVLFQSGGLIASMNLAENISLPVEAYTKLSKAGIKDLVDIKLRAVGLGGFENFIPSEISGGMKKRAGLARALALDPDIVCFDEPSSGLDPVTAAELDRLIVDLNQLLNSTMLVVTHDLASIMTISHRVIMLDKDIKGIIAQGTPHDLKNSENKLVHRFFNRIAGE